MKLFDRILIAFALVLAAPFAAAQQPANLDELLRQLQASIAAEGQINKEREAEFLRDRNNQQQLLARAQAELAAEEARSERLKLRFDDNEKALADFETVLQERMGNLGEMFGVVRQIAADIRGQFESSFVSAQIPGRTRFLANMAERKELPSIAELRQLWFEMQREITEQGKIVNFTTEIRNSAGELVRDAQVTRVGMFNALHDGQYLIWNTEDSRAGSEGLLQMLKKQPSDRFLSAAENFQSTAPGSYAALPVDFTRGVLLSLVVEEATLAERLDQGGAVGYVTLGLGAIGLLIALIQGLRLMLESMKVKSQLRSETPSQGNSLGRVLGVYTENPNVDVETLELKLDEAILKETGKLEWGLQLVKVIYVVAPLLGLLGTVQGMIQTFQQITLFGTGDPKTMAGGISTALVTTVEGLIVAIPLTILHSLLASRAKALIQTLEEQSAGLVAHLAEKRHGRTG